MKAAGMSDGDDVNGELTTAPECVALTADDNRLGRVSVASTVESSRQSMNDSAVRSHNAPSPLGRNSRNPANSPLNKVRCHWHSVPGTVHSAGLHGRQGMPAEWVCCWPSHALYLPGTGGRGGHVHPRQVHGRAHAHGRRSAGSVSGLRESQVHRFTQRWSIFRATSVHTVTCISLQVLLAAIKLHMLHTSGAASCAGRSRPRSGTC
jgi:hypothetical protein